MFELAQFAVALWGVGIDRARALRADDTGDRDLGATALEWAIISAILVTAAVLIGGIIYGVVQKKGSDLQKCSDTPVGGSC